ncbi:hypothetical protein [Halalkalibacter akibai]|uniref:Uncharacterized protein n=1 Tax=Halalkalibacter akibai (strain ATCC 43226 / DSM 21942 / CIP 109018 / JCM 9157 / 1139) TaxID=1236973 RepID=W4QU38_HALA3|nr:hypothetical protein [Halalkalibacter akibai]GAE35407.1 hypothetical protein JCM9157_2511 [Halalkalibacter akibai JCM 9157]
MSEHEYSKQNPKQEDPIHRAEQKTTNTLTMGDMALEKAERLHGVYPKGGMK